MNKKIFILGIVIASILAFIGIGFAAWGIINNLNKSSEGEFTGYTIIDLEDTADTSIDAFHYKTNGFVGPNQYSTSFSVTFDLKEKSEQYDVTLELIDEDSFLSNVTSTYIYGGNTVNGNKTITINNINSNREITITYTITTQSSDWSETGPIYVALEAGKNMYLKATANSNNGTWSIVKKIDLVTSLVNIQYISKPIPHQDTFIYNGNSQYCFESNEAYTLINNNRIDAGSQIVTVHLNENWQWSDYTTEDYEYDFYISPQPVSIPASDNRVFTYNGNEQIYYIEASNKYTVFGNTQTNANVYNVVVSLISNNFMWSDYSQSDKIYDFVINPKQISITSNLIIDNSINRNYSDVTIWSSFKSVFSSISFSESGFTNYNVYGMSDGTFAYCDNEKLGAITGKMFTLGHSGLKTTYDYVAGSTYRAYVELTTTNYELIGQDYVWLKYKTAKIGSTYYTIEDAIAAGGTNTITMVGNITTDETKVQITSFSKLLSTKSYTNSSKILTIPSTSGGTDTSYTPDNSSGKNYKTKTNVCACLYIPNGITYNTSKNINVLSTVTGEGAVKDHGVIVNDGIINITAGSLQSWGYTKGMGIINMSSGTTAVDVMKFNDYPGSASTAKTLSETVFPIFAWVLNNISCKTKYIKGSALKALATVWGSTAGYNPITVNVIGSTNGTNDCLFVPSNTNTSNSDYILKTGSLNDCNTSFTANNQVHTMIDIDMYGGYQDKTLTVSISKFLITVKFATSQTKPLPISFANINIKSGVLTISNSSYIFLQGTSLTVEEGAKLSINGNSYIVFDRNDTPLCSFFKTDHALNKVDSLLIINGELTGTGAISGKISTNVENASIEINNYSVTEGKVAYKTSAAAGTTNANVLSAMYKNFNIDTELNATAYTNIPDGSYNSIKDTVNNYGWISNSSFTNYTLNYIYNGNSIGSYSKGSAKSSFTITSADLNSNPIANNDHFKGYEFLGWYSDSELTTPFSSITLTNTSSEENVYAKIEKITYSIQFGYSDGENIENTYTYDSDYAILVNAQNPNYPKEFTIDITSTINLTSFNYIYNDLQYMVLGWVWIDASDPENPTYIRITTIDSSNVNEMIDRTDNKQLILFGFYSPYVEYTISYDLNGGILSIDNPSSYYVDTNTFILNNPTKEGYSFVGWSGTGLTGNNNLTVTIAKGSTGNRVYVANFSPITYDITYNLDGGTASGNPNNYTADQTYTLVNPTRAGYTFIGWSGTGLTGNNNMSVTIARGTTGNLSYTAHWQANQYVINYNGNGATSGTNYQTTVTYDLDKIAAIDASGHAFSNGSKPFIVWNTKTDGTGINYNPGDNIPSSDLTLYAIWGYTITFDPNGGSGTMNSQGVAPNIATSLNINSFTRTGYVFDKWNTKADGTGTDYNNGANITLNEDTTLYVQWKRMYTITTSTSNATLNITVNGSTVSSGGYVLPDSIVRVVLSYSESDSKTFKFEPSVTYYSDENCTTSTTSMNAGTYYFKMPTDNLTISASSVSGGICVAGDTLITLFDGSQKMIKDFDGFEKILTFNHFTGLYEEKDVLVIVNHGYQYNTKLRLIFSDESHLDIMNIHGLYCLTNREGYVAISTDNVDDYIGKDFAKQSDDLVSSYKSVTLVGYEIYEVYEEAYSLDSLVNLNAYANGFLSITTFNGTLNNYFEYDDNMKFDEDQMNDDIKVYGLYSYSEWNDVMPIEAFYALNIPYYKATIIKNNLSQDELAAYWRMFLQYQANGEIISKYL